VELVAGDIWRLAIVRGVEDAEVTDLVGGKDEFLFGGGVELEVIDSLRGDFENYFMLAGTPQGGRGVYRLAQTVPIASNPSSAPGPRASSCHRCFLHPRW